MFVIVNLLLIFLIQSAFGVVVNVKKLGKIEGSVEKSYHGRSYYSFEGIPYALPPLGVNRFANPKPILPWTGTIVAKTKYACLQLSGSVEVNGELPLAGQEDCLYINIYTPSIDKFSNFPVIFFIHGGGFRYGSGTEMGGQFLMDYDVVFVSFNYRLGPLGFLSTGDDILPGNMAMWDQNLALKFTNKYIKAFGGDSRKITIFGVSSGALSVQFHYLAKPSWGLFQRGFAQSGSIFNSWAIMEEPLMKTKMLAAQLNCPINCTITMVDCLRNKSGRDIIQQIERLQAWYNPWVPFSIIVDKFATNPIMEKHPYELMNNGKIYDVPFFTSFTNAEGLDPGSLFYTKENIQQLNTNWYKLAPVLLDYNFTVSSNLQKNVSEKIRHKYMGTKEISLETFTNLIPLFGDRLLYNGVKQAFDLQNSKIQSPVYLYQYFYRAAHSTSEVWTGSNEDFGASHADDTAMMLQFWVNTTTTPEDRKMQTIMTKLLVAYATTGKPDVEVTNWPPISKRLHNSFECMQIRSPSDIRMGNYVFQNEQFWNSLPIMENRKLFEN